MKRYDIIAEESKWGGEPDGRAIESNDGLYVLYTDLESALKAKDKELKELAKECLPHIQEGSLSQYIRHKLKLLVNK